MTEKTWKYKRAMYYSSKGDHEFDDYLDETDLEIVERFDDEEILHDAMLYFTEHREELRYPGKSFAVAVIYATIINQHYGDDIRESLADKDLLFDDPYFHPYDEVTGDIYESILSQLGPDFYHKLDQNLPYLEKTIDYCEKELMVHEDS